MSSTAWKTDVLGRPPKCPLTCDPRIERAERNCCSGVCIDCPCLDRYASNISCRCCLVPRYDCDYYKWDDFFENVVPTLHTGDVVLASWPSGVSQGTNISRCMGHSRSSHVGIIYRPSDCPSILKQRDRKYPNSVDKSRPLMLHMIAAGTQGCRHDNVKGGLDILDFEVYIKDYFDKWSHSEGKDGDVEFYEPHAASVRPLLGMTRDEQFYQDLENCVEKYLTREFEPDMTKWEIMSCQLDLCQDLLSEWLPCSLPWLVKEDNLEYLFCSTLVAEIHKAVGILPLENRSKEYVPAMWDTTRSIVLKNKKTDRFPGVYFGKERRVTGPRTLMERNSPEFHYPFIFPYDATKYPNGYPKNKRVQLSLEICGSTNVNHEAGGFADVDTKRKMPMRWPLEEKDDKDKWITTPQEQYRQLVNQTDAPRLAVPRQVPMRPHKEEEKTADGEEYYHHHTSHIGRKSRDRDGSIVHQHCRGLFKDATPESIARHLSERTSHLKLAAGEVVWHKS